LISDSHPGWEFSVLLDPIKAKVITSKGAQHWGGAASTMFWLGPEKEMWGADTVIAFFNNPYPP
jgi:hypothetical protein|tara:strand:- start:235 stop:426 length:192 start_codon:yes stop_codon:yes gene_type:complete